VLKVKSIGSVIVPLSIAVIGGLLVFNSCRLDTAMPLEDLTESAIVQNQGEGDDSIPLPPGFEIPFNPVFEYSVEKERTPELMKRSVKKLSGFQNDAEPLAVPSLVPSVLMAMLYPGEVVIETKTATIPGAPPLGDVMLAIDLTGSMGQELANIKTSSVAIMNAVRAVIPDTNFGVISHMDYDGEFGGSEFDYSDANGDPVQYGDYDNFGDYPYKLDQPLTADINLVKSAIGDSTSGLALGWGADAPESYTRVLYESYADGDIGWRFGAKKILLFWQDFIPHDLDPFLDGSNHSSGPDPGRNNDQTSDNLDLEQVLESMVENNITLIAIHSSSSNSRWPFTTNGIPTFNYWDKYAQETGGVAYQISDDGTIPGGIDIATLIADLINAEISRIDRVTLTAPGYEDWLVSVTPADYTGIDLSSPWTGVFTIQIQVPEGTAPGEYNFEVILDGDGVEYARQRVSITVLEDNQPPVADAGEDQTLEQTSCEGAEVMLDGSASSDPDGDALSYSWSWDGGNAEGVQPTATLPLGLTTVTLTVEDPSGLSDTDTVDIFVEDTTPPVIDFNLVSEEVWPPNHKLVKAAVVEVTDVCDLVPLASMVIEVTHNEDPHENTGVGDGHHAPDWLIEEDGTVWIRAERNGTGTGRIYTISVSAQDAAGNAAEAAVEVLVPHDQGKD
jgi:hypothetical protein